MPGCLGNFPNTQVLGKFIIYPVISEISKILKIYHPQIPIGIWEISQMPGYLGNFPIGWVSGIFTKCLGIWEISQMPRFSGSISSHLRNIPYSNIWEISLMPGYLGNFQKTQAFGKFPGYPGIWKISKLPIPLGNSPNTKTFEEFS